MLHKAADCDAYLLARDPTDMKLHTEDAVYFIIDGEQSQEGDCKHNTRPQSKHLTLRDARVERVAQHDGMSIIIGKEINLGVNRTTLKDVSPQLGLRFSKY